MFIVLIWLFSFIQPVEAKVVWTLPDVSSHQWPISHKGVEGRITIPFNGTIGRGVLPVFVELEHNGKKTVEVEVSLSLSNSSSGSLNQKLTLKPGEKVSYEWEVPLTMDSYYSYGSVFIDGGTVSGISVSFEQFSPEYFRSSMKTPPRLILSTPVSQKNNPEWFAASQLHGETNGGAKFLNSDLYLPAVYSGYSSLFTVVWFIDDVLIGAEKKKALANWVKGGGHLIVIDPQGKLQVEDEFSGWQEERFSHQVPLANSITGESFRSGISGLSRFEEDDYKKVMKLEGANLSKQKMWKMGFGVLTTISDRISMEQAYHLQMNFLHNQTGLYNSAKTTSFDGSSVLERDYTRGLWDQVTIGNLTHYWSELALVPDWVIVLLSYLFLMLVGPVNLMIARRNRVYLLFSTPLIAIVCVVIVFGVDMQLYTQPVKGLSAHRTLFDQRQSEVISNEQRLFFLSRKLSKELQPSVGSILLPISHDYNTNFLLEIEDGEQTYNRYADYRKVSSHWGWQQNTQRIKLEIENEHLQNNFAFTIDEIFYSDENGSMWTGQNVKPGKSIHLKEMSTAFKLKHWDNKTLPSFAPNWETLPKNSYIFRSKSIGLGVSDEISEGCSQKDQIVYGVL